MRIHCYLEEILKAVDIFVLSKRKLFLKGQATLSWETGDSRIELAATTFNSSHMI